MNCSEYAEYAEYAKWQNMKKGAEYAEYADWFKQSMPGSVVPIAMFQFMSDVLRLLED